MEGINFDHQPTLSNHYKCSKHVTAMYKDTKETACV